ncbi:MAG: MBL fold metallo-hydrolase [Ruminococcus sp.]|nr:MBL fold metallo-hydrolase [Ruminococcus sp.]
MKRFLCALSALMMMLFIGSCSRSAVPQMTGGDDDPKLTVHFIDVGEGDCTLLESDDEFVLIDAGERDYGEEVLRYIEDQGADELKYMIATHPHSDHVGGLRTVIDGMDTENFITVSCDSDTYTWEKLMRAVDRNSINMIEAEAGTTYSFGKASLTIMAPLSRDEENYNNLSVVTRVVCGDISFLIEADAERESEYEMVDAGETLSADVIRCGHHGSSDASSDKLLKAVNPAFGVASCGEGNEYGHPHRETVQKFETMGCPLLRTDEAGTIVAYTDGRNLRFEAEKTDLSSYTYTAGEEKHTAEKLKYIGNKNSLYFHYSDCDGAMDMKEKNKVYLDSRDDAVAQGYTPCPGCQP